MSGARGGLRLRLLVALIVVWALGVLAMTAELRRQSRQPDELLEDASLATQAKALIAGLRFDAQGRLVAVRPSKPWRRAYASAGAAYFTVFDPAGGVAAVSPNLAEPLAPIPLAAGETFTAQRLVGPEQDLAAAARAPHGYGLVVARSNPSRDDQSLMQRWADFLPGLIFVAFAGVGLVAAWLVAAWSLRPLGLAAKEAALIGPDRPEARLSIAELPTEIRPMAEAVNQALDRVAAAYANEKRFTAEAAHALRTPLAVLDLRLQRAAQGGHIEWPAVRGDLAELSRVVAGLLTLSRADRAGRMRTVAEVNLSRLAREAAAAFSPRLEALGRAIEVTAPNVPILLQGEAGELREMVFALIDNALNHGAGTVALDLKRQGEAIVLGVGDQGAGLPAAEWEAVFERFHKVDGTSPGAGLGLAIVRQIARNHGGDAHFVAASRVEVVLQPGVAAAE